MDTLDAMQARGMTDKAAELSLAYLFSRSDTDFAEQVCSSRRASTAVSFGGCRLHESVHNCVDAADVAVSGPLLG